MNDSEFTTLHIKILFSMKYDNSKKETLYVMYPLCHCHPEKNTFKGMEGKKLSYSWKGIGLMPNEGEK